MTNDILCDACDDPNTNFDYDGFALCKKCYEVSQDNLEGDVRKFKEAWAQLFNPIKSRLFRFIHRLHSSSDDPWKPEIDKFGER